jgi:hypothetical protein
MTLLPDLEAQLRDAAARTQPVARAVRARRTLRPRRRMLVIALLVLLALGSVAVAAVRLAGVGAPAPKTTGLGSPIAGPGRPLPGQIRFLDLRTADPDGGLPWGIRIYRTTRHAACWQVGRVLDGRLGLLGRDGYLADDGLFHELPVQVDQCRPLDGAGHLFAFQNSLGLDNGMVNRLTCLQAGNRGKGFATCPPGSMRLLLYGFLGPQARTASLDGGRPAAVAQEGAFLFALRVTDPGRIGEHKVTATYADGTTRPVGDLPPVESVPDPGGGRTPLPPGFVDPLRALPSPARVHARLHVTHRRRGKNTIYTLRFRSRVSLRRFGVDYTVMVDGPPHGGGRHCDRPLRNAVFGTGGDVGAGQPVTVRLTPGIAGRYGPGWCPGAYRVTVVLHDRAHPVGSFRFTG